MIQERPAMLSRRKHRRTQQEGLATDVNKTGRLFKSVIVEGKSHIHPKI